MYTALPMDEKLLTDEKNLVMEAELLSMT